MGKRSDFARIARDAYDTPVEAVLPLLPHLGTHCRFIEPCAGRGELVRHLENFGHGCIEVGDIAPRAPWIKQADALKADRTDAMYITNPPWARDILHPLIERLSRLSMSWLLFDADWVHTRQAIPFLPRLQRIVSVGRVKWIPGTTMTGKDNCAWYLFDIEASMRPKPIEFYGRTA